MNILKFSKYTNTTKFILPLLFDIHTRHHELFDNFFINAYIADVANKENDDKIHLLFADYPSLALTQKMTDPIAEYKYEDRYVLVYPLENKWDDDYNKLITGQYSTISEKAKDRILSFWEEDTESALYGVLYKEGNAVRTLIQEITGNKNNSPWTQEKEWWVPFEIPDEMMGLVR
jgi:hypothetical protein